MSDVIVVTMTKTDAAGGRPHGGPQRCWEVLQRLMVYTRGDPPMVKAARKPAQAEHCKMPEELPGHGWSHGQAQLQMDWVNREI